MLHFMQHKWQAVAAAPYRVGMNWLPDDRLRDVTFILYLCSQCSKPKVRRIEGQWTLEQLIVPRVLEEAAS